MPSAVTPATDLSAVAFAKLVLVSGRRFMRWCRTRAEPGDNWSTPGLTDVRHESRPQSEGSGGDSRLWIPLLRETADTPCRLSKTARAEVLSDPDPCALEDVGVFAST